MLNNLYRLGDYFNYLLTAGTKHSVHSPFMYRFISEILLSKSENNQFAHIETIRKKMIKSDTSVDYTDLGGGNKSGKRKLSELAANTAREAKYGRLLNRIITAFNPEYVIELGTGTGITTLYQAAALSPLNPLHTVEANPSLTDIVHYNATQMGIEENIRFYADSFENALPLILGQMPRVDFAYIDGNHRYDPTVQYFEQLLEKAHSYSIFVFDDINWSEEMKQSWSYIRNHASVTMTLDIFNFGIVFFRKENAEKEHFVIRY